VKAILHILQSRYSKQKKNVNWERLSSHSFESNLIADGERLWGLSGKESLTCRQPQRWLTEFTVAVTVSSAHNLANHPYCPAFENSLIQAPYIKFVVHAKDASQNSQLLLIRFDAMEHLSEKLGWPTGDMVEVKFVELRWRGEEGRRDLDPPG
jgi:hypothetical protein